MNRCLCCGREIEENNTWHQSCVKRFFGTASLPLISISFDEKDDILSEYVSKKESITGVQKKLSLHLNDSSIEKRLTLPGIPKGYILKANSKEIKFLPESEQLVMLMAEKAGIKTAMHALINTESGLSYITKRMDRSGDRKIHMEDFQQLSYRPTEFKYQSSYEKCAKIIDSYSKQPKFDKQELFYRLVFCFVTLN